MPIVVARSLVDTGSAVISNCSGKVKAVKLVATAATHARMIGPPTVATGPESVRFTSKAQLDIPALLWEHHPMCMYE